jgi:hypothetical protein
MCKICDSKARAAIDLCLWHGDSVRKVGTMFGTSKSEVDRHKRVCMKRTLPALAAPVPVPAYQTLSEVAITAQNVRSVTQRAGQLVDKMESLAQRFEETGDTSGLMKAAKEIREGLRLLAQLSGELSSNQVNVAVLNAPSMKTSPEWPIVLRILNECDGCRQKMVEELRRAGL